VILAPIMSAVLTGEREQVDTKPPKRQPAFAHEDRVALNEDSPFLLPRRRRCPAGPRGSGASLLVQLQEMQEIDSMSERRTLGAALPHGASHERPGVGWGVARLVTVRRHEGRPSASAASHDAETCLCLPSVSRLNPESQGVGSPPGIWKSQPGLSWSAVGLPCHKRLSQRCSARFSK